MKFELWFGCFGNGITVCNKAVQSNGEYKDVAHISDGGNIKLYVDRNYIPDDDYRKIENAAQRRSEEFRHTFELSDDIKQYVKILDSLPTKEFLEVLDDKRPIAEKLPELRERYYKIA